MRQIKRFDWLAFLSGAVVAFVSLIALQILLGSMGLYTRPSEPGLRRIEAAFLFVAGPAPGAVLAGYLHSSRIGPGVLYGFLASFFGITVPIVSGVLFFAVLIGVLSGEITGVLTTTSLVLGFLWPRALLLSSLGGIVGGAIGSLLRRLRIRSP